jgi:hypothetical protein
MPESPARQPSACLLQVVVAFVGLYLIARITGWVGPHATVTLEPRLLGPAVVAVTAWGAYRMLGRKPCP